MNDFGFTLSKSSRIDLDKADNPKFRELVKTEPDVLKCMACGSCAATCTAGQYSRMNFRRLILMLSRGVDEEVLRELDSCLLCGKCLLVCPRGINTRHALISVRKIYKGK